MWGFLLSLLEYISLNCGKYSTIFDLKIQFHMNQSDKCPIINYIVIETKQKTKLGPESLIWSSNSCIIFLIGNF